MDARRREMTALQKKRELGMTPKVSPEMDPFRGRQVSKKIPENKCLLAHSPQSCDPISGHNSDTLLVPFLAPTFRN